METHVVSTVQAEFVILPQDDATDNGINTLHQEDLLPPVGSSPVPSASADQQQTTTSGTSGSRYTDHSSCRSATVPDSSTVSSSSTAPDHSSSAATCTGAVTNDASSQLYESAKEHANIEAAKEWQQ